MQVNSNTAIRAPFVKLTFNDTSFQTSISKMENGEWNETFPFAVSFHFQLFGVLQVDLYESRVLLPALHIGRCELKLSRVFGIPDGFFSWFELWEKEQSDGNTTAIGRRSLTSRNVGAIKLGLQHTFTASLDPRYFPSFVESESGSVSELSRASSSHSSLQNVLMGSASHLPLTSLTAETVTPALPVKELGDDIEIADDYEKTPITSSATHEEQLKQEEDNIKVSSQYFYHEEEEELEEEGRTAGFLDRLGDLVLSKETSTVLKAIRKITAAYGQGLEMSNASLLGGVLSLEKFYINHGTKRTGKRVLELGKIEVARHYYKFTLASYGWKGLNFFGKGKGILVDAARADADRKSLLEFLAIPDDHLLELKMATNDLFRPGYFIAVDEIKDSIVLCIRGTMSTIDTLTDLVCEYTPFKDGLVHSGVKLAAEWFMTNTFDALVKYLRQFNKHNLIVCGHSLGGATTAMLSMMIVDSLERLTLDDGSQVQFHGYCYGPPPIASLNLAKKYDKYIDTYVAEDDFVCRLSYGHMMDLKTMIICAVESETKDISFLTELWKGITGAPRRFSKGLTPSLNTLAACRETLSRNQDLENMHVKLFLVGDVHFMYYEDPNQKPYSSLTPKYKDLDVHNLSPLNRSLNDLNVNAESAGTNSTSSPVKESVTAPQTTQTSPSTNLGSQNSMRLSKKVFKRVVVERSRQEYFDEVAVKRTMFLEHMPNAYDKALDRAFETVMIDLRRKSLDNLKSSTSNINT